MLQFHRVFGRPAAANPGNRDIYLGQPAAAKAAQMDSRRLCWQFVIISLKSTRLVGILRKMQIKSERFGSHRVEYLNLCELNSLNSNTKSSNYGPRHLLLYNYCINMAIASIAAILNSQSITRVGLLAEWTLLVLFYFILSPLPRVVVVCRLHHLPSRGHPGH